MALFEHDGDGTPRYQTIVVQPHRPGFSIFRVLGGLTAVGLFLVIVVLLLAAVLMGGCVTTPGERQFVSASREFSDIVVPEYLELAEQAWTDPDGIERLERRRLLVESFEDALTAMESQVGP